MVLYVLTTLVLDWDFLLETKRLSEYTEWLDIRLQEKYHDEAWMKQFEQFAPMQAKEETSGLNMEPRQGISSTGISVVLTTYSPATPMRKSTHKGK